MIKKLLYLNLLHLLSVLGVTVNAQEYCSFDEINKRYLVENPQVQQMVNIAEKEISLAMKSGRFQNKNAGQIYEIPVVVHVFADKSTLGTLGNPSDAQIIEWIDFTNKLYANTYYSGNNSTPFPFRLVLAKRNPNCQNTNGIVRFNLSGNQDYNDFGLKFNGAKGITEAELRQMSRWDPTSYYNIYVTNKIDGFNGTSGSGTNGYAYLYGAAGGSVDGAYHHAGVVGKEKPTLGHEFGHALGLYHTFGQGDSTKECQTTSADDAYTTGDLVHDTAPTINGNYYYSVYGVSQPTSAIINGCSKAPFDNVVTNVMNYGSYRNKFTQGQVDRSVALFLEFRLSLLKSKALVPINPNETSSSPIPSQCRPQNLINKAADGRLYNIGITKVKFGTINVSSGTPMGTTGVVFYTDNTTKSCISNAFTTNVEAGSVVNIELTDGGNTDAPGRFSVFVDYNNDGIFGSNETVIPFSIGTNGLLKTAITIPTTAVQNIPLRMRVVGDYAGSITACGDLNYGEAEDYTVIITAPAAVIWNGTTWSSEPTTAKEAIVRGNLSLTTNVSAKKLTVESGSVTVKKGSVLTVENEIVNNLTADKFIVEDGASVLQTNATANVGNVTVLKNSTPMVFNDATLWSSPVDGQNVRSFSPATLDKRFYIYNEGTNKFASLFVNDPLYPNSSLQNPNTYNFVAGLGYHIRVSNNQTQTEPGLAYAGKFIGKLNNGVITQPITKNGSGYNLLGNPYPSAIDAKKLIQANSSVQALHFWTHEAPLTSTGYVSNNYASYNLTGGTQAAAGGLIPNNIINPGQGFIVETTASGSLTFDNSLRTGSLTGSFYKTSESDEKRIWIDLFEGATPKNQILIGYIENATNSFDNQMDATVNKLYTGSTLYSLIDNLTDHFVIQGRSLPFNQNDVVKVGFEAKEKATYTIKLNNVENLDKETTVFLKDKADNQIVDLSKTDYSFDSEIGTYNDRFEIVYTNKTLGTDDLKVQEISVYKQNGQLVVKSPKEIKNIEVYDISGRKIYTKSITGKEVALTGLRSTNQVLVIKVTTTDNKINNTKILY